MFFFSKCFALALNSLPMGNGVNEQGMQFSKLLFQIPSHVISLFKKLKNNFFIIIRRNDKCLFFRELRSKTWVCHSLPKMFWPSQEIPKTKSKLKCQIELGLPEPKLILIDSQSFSLK